MTWEIRQGDALRLFHELEPASVDAVIADPPYSSGGFSPFPGWITCHTPRGEDREHITEKPLELTRALVRIAPPGGLVVDPFTGSGTTGAACLAEGRRFIGFEKDPGYVAIARRRIAGPLFAGAEDAIQ